MPTRSDDSKARAAVRALAVPLSKDDSHEALLDLIGDAPLVMLGEASHGTHEFYRERARITRRLIAEKGFRAVAIEGDWPDAYRVDRFVRGQAHEQGRDRGAVDALAGFRRFPTWMWRNTEVVDFVNWQCSFNLLRPEAERTGFYGLDLYSLHASMSAVLGHLVRSDPQAARLARERYACFEQFGEDSQVYGLMTGLGHAKGCEDEVMATLLDLRTRAQDARRGQDDEAAFDAEQNARLVKNAESYYRSMVLSNVSSWNLRDQHMAETLWSLQEHLARDGREPKVVVWAHNSHIGDARATDMGRRGEWNLGQLARERHGRDAVLVGFSTHDGTVTAASDWDGETERKQVLPSREDSHEGLMHATGIGRFLLPLRDSPPELLQALRAPRLERAIGVIYRPETERLSHYFSAQLVDQFDALIHIDTTRALQPLEPGARWHGADAPATYPAGV